MLSLDCRAIQAQSPSTGTRISGLVHTEYMDTAVRIIRRQCDCMDLIHLGRDKYRDETAFACWIRVLRMSPAKTPALLLLSFAWGGVDKSPKGSLYCPLFPLPESRTSVVWSSAVNPHLRQPHRRAPVNMGGHLQRAEEGSSVDRGGGGAASVD